MNVKALSLLLLFAASALHAGAAVYPFPQNQSQPTTAYYPAYNNADVQFVYDEWKADQVTAAGAGGFRRVQRNGDVTLQANSTVSEGIAYGMIISVYMNDQALFDDLWRYHNLHLDGNGLMNWYISADGNTTLGAGAASDADQDIAWALVMAHHQWGTSAALPQPYLTYAQDMIGKIWTHEVEKPSMVFRNGDGWGGAATLNVSYFDPSMYRVFAQVSGNDGWYDVVDTSYQALFASLNATNGNANNGLVPAWSNLAGQPVVAFAGAPTHFQYDSCRTPFRIGKDWYFFGEPRAKQYLDKINSFYVPIGAGNITDGYDLNGAERPQYDTLGNGDTGQSGAFIAPAMVGAMDVPGQAAFVQEAYDNLKTNTLLIGGPYYDQSWTVMGLLFASGNYLNYQPTPTPTPTPDACQFRVRVNAAGGASNGFSADQAYTAGSWGYVAGYAGAIGTSGGPVTGTSMQGLYLDERYDASATGEVRYSFSVPNGPATVTLHWAETYFNSAGQRRMDVYVGATRVEQNLDVWTAAGGQNKALVRSYNTTVAGGVLTLRFDSITANATIHAIEITAGNLCSPTVSPTRTPAYSSTPTPTRTPSFSPSPSFTVSPTRTASPTPYPTPDACSLVRRVNAGGGTFAGAGGLNWSADQAYTAGNWGYVAGFAGTVGTSGGPIGGTTDDDLFEAERWGNPVRYRFDLPNGAYQVRVRFAETYFGTAGQRNVSLSSNGSTVLNNIDLFTWAGGQNVARDHTFFASVSAGALVLETWSSNNNGTFQAIEVIGLAGCTATPTPALSSTASPSRTPSRSPSGTPSASASPSATPSRTATATGSPTQSATRTPSPVDSPTASPTRTPTAADSPTATPSASPSFTPTPTATRSATATPTPTRSATPSPSPTFSVSPLASATASSTPSPVFSATLTPSSSPPFSATHSPTQTLSSSLTPSATQTATATATPSVTATLSETSSATAGPSVTPSFTATLSMTPTVTLTRTPSASATGTGSATGSPTRTVIASASQTPTPTRTASPAPPFAPTDEPLRILDHALWPNPVGRQGAYLSVKLQGAAQKLRFKLYSRAHVLVATHEKSGVQAGWNQMRLDAPLWEGLAVGAYFYRVEAVLGGDRSPAVAPGVIYLSPK